MKPIVTEVNWLPFLSLSPVCWLSSTCLKMTSFGRLRIDFPFFFVSGLERMATSSSKLRSFRSSAIVSRWFIPWRERERGEQKKEEEEERNTRTDVRRKKICLVSRKSLECSFYSLIKLFVLHHRSSIDWHASRYNCFFLLCQSSKRMDEVSDTGRRRMIISKER